ncbi:MAG: hypothetical protein QXG17_00775 [Sulfolobales archaeon]
MVTIQVPLNISGFWVPHRGKTHEDTGSLGASLTIEPPAVFKITRGSCPVYINGACMEEYHPITQELSAAGVSVYGLSPIPLGVGSAVSGALAIALAYSYLYLKQGIRPDPSDVGLLAHKIEVEVGGGLGDVICQTVGGGLVLRKKPGPPGIGEAISLPVEDVEVTLGVLGDRMTTKEMLTRFADRFMNVGLEAYRRFIAEPNLRSFLRLSREFSKGVGFMPQEIVDRLEAEFSSLLDGVLGYFIKKSLLVVVHKPGMSSSIRRIVEKICSYSIPSFKLSKQGFTVSL